MLPSPTWGTAVRCPSCPFHVAFPAPSRTQIVQSLGFYLYPANAKIVAPVTTSHECSCLLGEHPPRSKSNHLPLLVWLLFIQ